MKVIAEIQLWWLSFKRKEGLLWSNTCTADETRKIKNDQNLDQQHICTSFEWVCLHYRCEFMLVTENHNSVTRDCQYKHRRFKLSVLSPSQTDCFSRATSIYDPSEHNSLCPVRMMAWLIGMSFTVALSFPVWAASTSLQPPFQHQ